ncbi:pyridine nucleotide-disulfide oxidoreductase family protein [Aspergillus sclerotioniger CBS 115572]|uniref:Pyridine nucleotide-disulfide oxidoreductase family protein n=1 Tax=Aspergillus sclerotioniger CBS 115572 TaxID=1450535 RepID=A0A317WVE4_9EURO|nr:pyridine nucleotide-disulfide oxidoreductase family protein [Aspergillus sclerotioniger CBS 115572]PWY88818.1 pyridine nucleotide-disulfide oxidoreductase family protein [Aspergillus sclerotioniger CBS 115572]
MASKIVIIGAGFAGVWSALAAKRLINLNNKENNVEVLVIAPEPTLVMRIRLYETNASSMTHPLGPLFEAAGIKYIQGTVTTIQPETHSILVQSPSSPNSTIPITYNRLILAAGSTLIHPPSITGLQDHAFNIDSLPSATKLNTHLSNLPSLPETSARDTIAICGAGFTGIELATELPKRLTHLPNPRIVLIDTANEIGPELGAGPRPIITEAINALKIHLKLNSSVTSITADSVTLSTGETIQTNTTIWTAGVKATPLTHQIPSPKDHLSRLHVTQHLRVPSTPDIFATGDVACVLADTEGHYALMSCQHALELGRVAGHNAAADLLGESRWEYSQAGYVTCLDLGAWGAVVSQGWEREVRFAGELAKRVKGFINGTAIYPPVDVEEALGAAAPGSYQSDVLLEEIVKVVG